MARIPWLLAAICYFFTLAWSASVHIKIPVSSLLNPNALPSTTHATLTSGSGTVLDSRIRKDNSILFTHITSTGSHLLKIYTRDYVFASYRIDIAVVGETSVVTGAWETHLGSPWTDVGVPLLAMTATGQPTPIPSLTIHPKVLTQKQFYEDRPAFSPLVLLKNPMVLMGIVGLAFTVGMPKLMENMDPEMRAEYEEMQKKSPMTGITNAMQGGGAGAGSGGFDLAGYLAGQSTGAGKATGRDAGDIRERRK